MILVKVNGFWAGNALSLVKICGSLFSHGYRKVVEYWFKFMLLDFDLNQIMCVTTSLDIASFTNKV